VDARASVAAALCASFLLHAGLGASLRGPVPAPRNQSLGGIELPSVAVSRERGFEATETPPHAPKTPAHVAPGAPRTPANFDTTLPPGSRAEHGGSLVWIEAMPSPSDLTLRDADLNNTRQSQVQRIDTSEERRSVELRRATPNAADEFFLASGRAGPAERLPESQLWPRAGGSAGDPSGLPQASSVVTRPEDSPADPGADAQPLAPKAEVQRGAEAAAPSPGATQRRRGAPTRAAPRAFARPAVDRASAATMSDLRGGPVADNMAAELLAASLQRSIVDTSRARGAIESPGDGLGGTPGVGLDRRGEGRGGHAPALRPGPGKLGILDTRDTRYVRWFGEQRARVAEHLSFPRARALAMDQGQAIVALRVRRSGAFDTPPALYRSSGYPDFDAAALHAVRATAELAPLPEELLPGQAVFSLLLPIRFENPMVR